MPSKERRAREGTKASLITRTVGPKRHVTIYHKQGNKSSNDVMRPAADFTVHEADVLVLLSGWARRSEWVECEPNVFVSVGEKEKEKE